MKTIHINEAFTCTSCGEAVLPAPKTCRDHCTNCLCSLHVDDALPGDRASTCGGVLRPSYALLHQKKGIMIHFTCETCGIHRQNKASEDDNQEVLAQLIVEANRRAAGIQ